MRLLTFAIPFCICSALVGQTRQYQNLLDTALKGHGALIICSKPITNVKLDQREMLNYFYSHRDYANKLLDTIMFAGIVKNSKSVDTTQWQDNELEGYLLVSNRDINVPMGYVIRKLGRTKKNEIKTCKNEVRLYNSTDGYNRNLYYFSRPVFDNSKKYAIVQWDNAHGGLGGSGGITLYQLLGNTWTEAGIIINWKY